MKMDLKQLLNRSSTPPQKMLRIVLVLAAVLLALWLLMVSRMEIGNESQRADRLIAEPADSSRIALFSERQSPVERDNSGDRGSPIFMNALTTFLILMVLLATVWFWSRNRSASAHSEEPFRELGRHMLGQGAQINVIEINEEVWVLGVSGGSVNLLHRCPADEWKQKPDTEPERESRFYNLFKSMS